MRRLGLLLPALLLAAPALRGPAGPAVAAGPAPVARLALGRGAFWDAAVRPAVRVGQQTVRDYPIVVPAGADRLRVAFDHPNYRQYFFLQVLDPAGRTVESGGGYNSGELVVSRPPAGTWVARLSGADGDVKGWRLRAIAERAPAPHRGPAKQLLPNLRLVPPYEFTFSGTAGSLGGAIAGAALPTSCTPDDIAEYQAVRCLRFSLGPSNVGAGPFEMHFAEGEGLVLPGKAVQRIHLTDGRTVDRDAGEFLYHKTHMHYHHTGFGTLELLRVDDAKTGRMTSVGTGPKQGFCTADVMLAEWHSFANAPQNSAPSQCVSEGGGSGRNNPTGTAMAISAGWADLYSWEQDGNYVEFGTNGDGLYVVRSTTDALGHVLESDETDNTGYAYIRVQGTTITVLERGRGQSPWDRRKVIVRDGLRPTAES